VKGRGHGINVYQSGDPAEEGTKKFLIMSEEIHISWKTEPSNGKDEVNHANFERNEGCWGWMCI
jgi:hypothetical protein